MIKVKSTRNIILKMVIASEKDGNFLEALNMLRALRELPEKEFREGDALYFRAIEARLYYQINKIFYNGGDHIFQNRKPRAGGNTGTGSKATGKRHSKRC